MQVYKLPEQFDEAVKEAAEVLRRGDVIVYPTDTIYGIGADALNEGAVRKVREIKGRSEKNMLLVLVADVSMMEEYGVMNTVARKIAELFLPGPLALILDAKKEIPAIVSGEYPGTIGLRIPHHDFCLRLAREFGGPYITTSANLAGHATPATIDAVIEQLQDRASMISLAIDGGPLASATPSTIVDVRKEAPLIFREGAISRENILQSLTL